MAILKLTQQGFPSAWLSHEQAAVAVAKDQVCWSLGEKIAVLHGGINHRGIQSRLEIPAIIATKGASRIDRFVPGLSNPLLFKRDNNQCLYCGHVFNKGNLTRDHVIPRGQGGRDTWMNVVSACGRCNHRKGCRTPEQANMPLLAVPFVPNPFEFMYLAAHVINDDQLNYLSSHWTSKRHWAA